MKWVKHIKIRHLLTDEEDYESIKQCMGDIATVLEAEKFPKYLIKPCRNIPEEYSLAVANEILNDVYDYVDMERIWIE